ncbi:MAG: hypothetical protein JSW73_03755 [Candidatus Woesearchaeota archaeon]|nr:MAG: hypothetical protein JSW73_03755 [Candidatus Woesearchaeota archaeon]
MKINLKDLEKFKTSGKYQQYVYEASKTKTKDPFLPRFKKIEYSIGDYRAIDRYTGGENFAGENVIFYKEIPVFVANYFGYIIDKKFNIKTMYDFLSKALAAGHGKVLFRGLDGFSEKGFKYINKIKGDLEFAKGTEEIHFKGKKIYELFYHAGIIIDSRSQWDWNL